MKNLIKSGWVAITDNYEISFWVQEGKELRPMIEETENNIWKEIVSDHIVKLERFLIGAIGIEDIPDELEFCPSFYKEYDDGTVELFDDEDEDDPVRTSTIKDLLAGLTFEPDIDINEFSKD